MTERATVDLAELRARADAAPQDFESPPRFRDHAQLTPPRREPAGSRLGRVYANDREVDAGLHDVAVAYANRGEAHRRFLPAHTKAGADGWFVDVLLPTERATPPSLTPGVVHRQTLRPARQDIGFHAPRAALPPPRDRILRDHGRRNQLWVESTEATAAGYRLPVLVRRREWPGEVLSVAANRFVAFVEDPADPRVGEQIEFFLEHVSVRDRDLVQPGGLFTWVLGYREEPDGSRLGVSIVQFIRVPPVWTGDQRKRAEARAARFIESLPPSG